MGGSSAGFWPFQLSEPLRIKEFNGSSDESGIQTTLLGRANLDRLSPGNLHCLLEPTGEMGCQQDLDKSESQVEVRVL